MNELPYHLQENCLIITNPPVRNRIKNELIKLINSGYCDSQSIYIERDYIERDKFNINLQNYCIINIFSKINNKNYRFFISNSYPFIPPKIELQYKSYWNYLKIYSYDFKELLYKYKGITCFCCYTKTCINNWSPLVTIVDIINESIENYNICLEISHRVIINVIKRKYLIDDIDIITWLY